MCVQGVLGLSWRGVSVRMGHRTHHLALCCCCCRRLCVVLLAASACAQAALWLGPEGRVGTLAGCKQLMVQHVVCYHILLCARSERLFVQNELAGGAESSVVQREPWAKAAAHHLPLQGVNVAGPQSGRVVKVQVMPC